MVLYLDNSFLNRPFDNPDVKYHRLEAEILFFVLELARQEKVAIVNSSVITYENSLNPFEDRRVFVDESLKHASIYQNLNEQIRIRSMQLVEKMKLSSIDSLHLATAEHAGVDFFITCDYNLIRRYKWDVQVVTPLQFLTSYENNNSN